MVHHEILETPCIKAAQGVWTAYGEAIIDAPAEKVYAAVRDLQSYSKWNEYTPTINTPSGSNNISVDDMVTLYYRPGTSGSLMAVPCRVMAISDEDLSICWRGCPTGVPEWALLPEKVQKVTRRGDSQCLYQIYETQMGPMAYIVKYFLGQKQKLMNEGIAKALKSYVEGGQGAVADGA
ncbi:hypothetical protein HII31_01588 [Pseudocercospora fuligena]|uniref:Coenzyme Q-binding protein COQ10 START domain-containing protein n=1 Tax=Pseudocercospora fuligena TaxID=685502 RepID=A0A8H6RTN8_9PEZI|nr:hypothetical protein HII31_01588 [Pseudocercospora fuligena]